MEGGFFDELRQFEFFPGSQDEKCMHSCVPVIAGAAQLSSSDHLNQGIYPDEESVDLSVLLEACNSERTSTAPSDVASTVSGSTVPVYQETSSLTTNSNFQSFPNFLAPDISLSHLSMYGNENYDAHMHGHVEMTPSSPSLGVDCGSVPSPHVVQIDPVSNNGLVAMRPAIGKAQRPSKVTKKSSIDKCSTEYRLKRDRNNIAVRKSREKSKIRVHDTEKRVKELEEENMHLQSKIALLTKELNVLKSLFTSAGVTQPSSFHVKDEGLGQK